MNKALAMLALSTVPALLLSACNGNTTTGTQAGALPTVAGSARHVHPNDNGPQDLHAGGATFPAFAYNKAVQPVGSYTDPQPTPGANSLFAHAGTIGAILYCLVGSGSGRKAFEGGNQFPTTGPCAPLGQTATGLGARVDPPDFVGSDVAMPSTEYPTYKTNREPPTGTNYGEPFEIPTIGGPIVFGYRPQDLNKHGITHVKLSAWSYCAIANGTISDWNDPALTADNGTSLTGGTSQPITFYFRSDSSGTSFLFTNHVNTACNVSWPAPYNAPPYQGSGRSAAWPYGVNSTWPGPGSSGHANPHFIGESGNPGVLAAIQSTAFSTGYVEGAYAASASPKVSQAHLQNGTQGSAPFFADPTNRGQVALALKNVTSSSITFGGGSDGLQLGTSRPECVLYIDPSHFVTPSGASYPIVGLSYFLFYGNNNGVHVSDKQTLIKYIGSTSANSIVRQLEYAPLSSSIHTAVLKALNGHNRVAPCLK